MATEHLDKLRMQKKFKNLKSIHKLLENVTQLEEYLTGQVHSFTENSEDSPSRRLIHVDKDFHYLFETDPSSNSTRITEIRSGDISLSATIEDNFFYQHMFNFALVIILLLQVIVVWAFIWCRLAKYGRQEVSSANAEDGIALRDIGNLPEVIPQNDNNNRNVDENGNDEDDEGVPRFGVVAANRCGRYG